VTPDGQSVVIGGLVEKSKTDSTQKVPVLGDIPIFGMLFRHKSTADTKKELLIFLTPHIINTREKVTQLSEEETKRATMAPEAFKDADPNKYFDSLRLAPPSDNNSTNAVPVKKKEPAPASADEPAPQSTRKNK